MAYKIIDAFPSADGARPIITAVLDSAADLAALQASGDYYPGSTAVVADTDLPAYMVNASGEWKAV